MFLSYLTEVGKTSCIIMVAIDQADDNQKRAMITKICRRVSKNERAAKY